MTAKLLVVAVLTLASLGCGNPLSPRDDGADHFTWTVDGQSFEASQGGMHAVRANGTINLTGHVCLGGAQLSIGFLREVTPGTYGPEVFGASYLPDGSSTASSRNWFVFLPLGGTGTVTVTSVSANRVSGSFALTMVAGISNPEPGAKSVQGTFNLPFDSRTIC